MLLPLILAAAVASAPCDKDAMQQRALDVAVQELGQAPNELDAEWGQISKAEVARLRKRIGRFRDRATHVANSCSREAYLRWAWYYDYQLNEVAEELRTHAGARRQAAWERGQRELDRRANAQRLAPLPRR